MAAGAELTPARARGGHCGARLYACPQRTRCSARPLWRAWAVPHPLALALILALCPLASGDQHAFVAGQACALADNSLPAAVLLTLAVELLKVHIGAGHEFVAGKRTGSTRVAWGCSPRAWFARRRSGSGSSTGGRSFGK